MRRRALITAIPGAAALAGPAAPRRAAAQGRGARERVLRFVPQANLSSLDPITTTAYVVRNHGYMVYDTLFGTDAGLVPRPQMAEGAVEEQDGRHWTVSLRGVAPSARSWKRRRRNCRPSTTGACASG